MALVAGAVWCVYILIRKVNPRLPMVRVLINGKVFTAELAMGVLEKARGLSGRDGLPEDGGMLFLFRRAGRHGFWMMGMKFPIDFVWIRHGAVVGISQNAQPQPGKAMWSLNMYYPPEGIDRVLEVNAGAIKKFGLKVGDPVVIK